VGDDAFVELTEAGSETGAVAEAFVVAEGCAVGIASEAGESCLETLHEARKRREVTRRKTRGRARGWIDIRRSPGGTRHKFK
jgi:hypothetical protein